MISISTVEQFQEAIIAQHDDNDYDQSGYVVVVKDGIAAISRYGHCSCYDTWCDLTGGGVSDRQGPNPPRWDWTGSLDQLKNMAVNKLDPSMPDRIADSNDYDYDHLMAVYEQVISWFESLPNAQDNRGASPPVDQLVGRDVIIEGKI